MQLQGVAAGKKDLFTSLLPVWVPDCCRRSAPGKGLNGERTISDLKEGNDFVFANAHGCIFQMSP